MKGETRGGRGVSREWADFEAKRKEFEEAHQFVVYLTHPATGEIPIDQLAAAWSTTERAYRAYSEAYRAFFHAADRRR